LQIRSSANREIQLGSTAGSFSNSTYFTDLSTLGTVINLTRSTDGVFAHNIFSYTGTLASGSGDNLGIASRSDIKFVVGAIADRGMIIKESGNVGIGTTSPGARLQVHSNNTAAAEIGGISIRGASDPLVRLNMGYDEAGGYAWIQSVRSTDVKKNLFLDANRIGIGTTTPSTSLSVFGGGISIDPGVTSKPSCTVSTRGTVWNTFGAAGVADTFQVCQKNAADVYSWITK